MKTKTEKFRILIKNTPKVHLELSQKAKLVHNSDKKREHHRVQNVLEHLGISSQQSSRLPLMNVAKD